MRNVMMMSAQGEGDAPDVESPDEGTDEGTDDQDDAPEEESDEDTSTEDQEAPAAEE